MDRIKVLGWTSGILAICGIIIFVSTSNQDIGFERGFKEGVLQSTIGNVKIVENIVLIYTDSTGKKKTFVLTEEDEKKINKEKEKKNG